MNGPFLYHFPDVFNPVLFILYTGRLWYVKETKTPERTVVAEKNPHISSMNEYQMKGLKKIMWIIFENLNRKMEIQDSCLYFEPSVLLLLVNIAKIVKNYFI